MIGDTELSSQLLCVISVRSIADQKQLARDVWNNLMENQYHIFYAVHFSEIGGMYQNAFVIWRNGSFEMLVIFALKTVLVVKVWHNLDGFIEREVIEGLFL